MGPVLPSPSTPTEGCEGGPQVLTFNIVGDVSAPRIAGTGAPSCQGYGASRAHPGLVFGNMEISFPPTGPSLNSPSWTYPPPTDMPTTDKGNSAGISTPGPPEHPEHPLPLPTHCLETAAAAGAPRLARAPRQVHSRARECEPEGVCAAAERPLPAVLAPPRPPPPPRAGGSHSLTPSLPYCFVGIPL